MANEGGRKEIESESWGNREMDREGKRKQEEREMELVAYRIVKFEPKLTWTSSTRVGRGIQGDGRRGRT